MPEKIDYQAMDDHDLLVMNVMSTNQCVRHLERLNSSVEQHEKRISALELSQRDLTYTPTWSKKKTYGYGSAVFLAGSFVMGGIQFLFENVL